ncbi:hypothetical protein [Marinimicrobium sp. C2-29]|uniref:hypothetical protein n=1 Tax=Marinimicrobium sp. C2-29 TaxID=3139825 RepID=UPI00313A32A7
MKKSVAIKLGASLIVGAVLVALVPAVFLENQGDGCSGGSCDESRASELKLLEDYRVRLSELSVSAQKTTAPQPGSGRTGSEKSVSGSEREERSSETIALEQQHGYYSEYELEEYRSYTTEGLEKLLEGGDLRALPILVDRYHEAGDHRSMEDASIVSAIHGSSRGLTSLATFNSPSKRTFDPDSEKDRLGVLKSQAFLHAATLLGDPLSEKNAKVKLDHLGVALTDGERMMVDQLGHEVIDLLNAKRSEIGLGPLNANDQPYEPGR